MKPEGEWQETFHLRSRLRWNRVLLWAGLFAVVLFTPVDWSGCGFFLHGAAEFLHFIYVFAWFVVFFALRSRWKLLLLVVTAPLVFYSFGLNGAGEENAAPEAAAVGALRDYQSSLNAYSNEHHQLAYPELLPTIVVSQYAKFYVFKYVPTRDVDGKIASYLIEATPRRRECGFNWSFTISNDGKVFYTHEPRAATTADKIME